MEKDADRSAASGPHKREQRYSAFGFLTARLPDVGPALSRSRVSHPAFRVERRDADLLP
jgi:hypothetical protein